MFIKKLCNSVLILVLSLLVGFFPFISGCDDSGVIPEVPPLGNDSNVISYPNLSVTYYFSGTNDTSFIAVNLWEGRIERDLSTSKDMTLRDSANTFVNFYFRSGDLSLAAPGFRTRFYQLYPNLSQSRFDTMTVIPAGPTLDSLDFTQDDTRGGESGLWGYFNAPLSSYPVYSFYLKGKFAAGITPKRIYGLLYIKNAIAGADYFTLTFDVRINKNGENWFRKTP